MPRGKRNKIKKMKEKYADQDEEEREMRLMLLGAKDVKGFDLKKHQDAKLKFAAGDATGKEGQGKGRRKPKAESSSEEESDEDDEDEKQKDGPKDDEKDNEEAGVKDAEEAKIEPDVPADEDKIDEDLDEAFLKDQMGEDIDPDAIMEEDADADLGEEDENEMESKDIQQILKEEDITLVPESSDISEVDKLTGLPNRKDTLLFGIPMLAPYTTIQSNKYKVKITPGTQKRGRVQKTIKDLFVKIGKESKIETQHLKSISDQEMTMTLINSCKVQAAGLTMLQ